MDLLSKVISWISLYPLTPFIKMGLTLLSYYADNKVFVGIAAVFTAFEALATVLVKAIFKKKLLFLCYITQVTLVFTSYLIVSIKVNLSNRSDILTFTAENSPGKKITPIKRTFENGFEVITLTKGVVALEDIILKMPSNVVYKIYSQPSLSFLGAKRVLLRDNWSVSYMSNTSAVEQFLHGTSNFTFSGQVLQLSSTASVSKGLMYFLGETETGSYKVLTGSSNGKFSEVDYSDLVSSSDKNRKKGVLHPEDVLIGNFDVDQDFSVLIDPLLENPLEAWPPIFPLEYKWLNNTRNAFFTPTFFGYKPISSIRLTKTGNLFIQETKTVFQPSGEELYSNFKGFAAWLVLLLNFLPMMYPLLRSKAKFQLIMDTLPFFTFEQSLILIESEFKLVLLLSLGWFSLHFCSIFGYSDRFFTSVLRFKQVLKEAQNSDSCFRNAILRKLRCPNAKFSVDFEKQHISAGNLKLNNLFFTAYLVNMFEYELSFSKILSYTFFDGNYDVKRNPSGFPDPFTLILKDGVSHRLFSKQGYIRNFEDFETVVLCYSRRKHEFLQNLRRYGLLEKYNYERLCKVVAYVMLNLKKPLPGWLQHKNVSLYDLTFTVPVTKTTEDYGITTEFESESPSLILLQDRQTTVCFNIKDSLELVHRKKTVETKTDCFEYELRTSSLFYKSNRTKVLRCKPKRNPTFKMLNNCCTKCLSTAHSLNLIRSAQEISPFRMVGRKSKHTSNCVSILNQCTVMLEKVKTFRNSELRNKIISEAKPTHRLGKHSQLDKLLLMTETEAKLKKLSNKGLKPSDLKPKNGKKYSFFAKGEQVNKREIMETYASEKRPHRETKTLPLTKFENCGDLKAAREALIQVYPKIPDEFKIIYRGGQEIKYKVEGDQLFKQTRRGFKLMTEEEFNAELESYMKV
jgi:hypothetical protein